MSSPEGTPHFIAELMTRCWNDDPDKRPNIKHIAHWLSAALKSSAPENFSVSHTSWYLFNNHAVNSTYEKSSFSYWFLSV